MFKKRKNQKYKTAKRLAAHMGGCSQYILDDENIVVVYENDNKKQNEPYIMVHYKIENETPKKVNQWLQNSFFYKDKKEVIRKHHLLMIQNHFMSRNSYSLTHNCLYNYEKRKMIVEAGTWDDIVYTASSVAEEGIKEFNFLKEYNCLIAYFKLQSTEKEDDLKSFKHPITETEKTIDLTVYDQPHFAILNPDGTIRDNKLLIGDDFFSITSIVDLDEYESIEEYKQQRIEQLNKKRKEKELEFQELTNKNTGYLQTYQEIEKILRKK